ncbi:hypothetical protein CORC01_00392 [Colletotrichum orchidophilum]|uniref:Uncharacterized protein n=1 Tax=Colletotrichum orchidophilum TaxID=1209926 RepID=A0A1G4BRR5_9PEZI|nr:uncharacterized protein CORC01_00392 [Colletotrichum orchidophilum]OHF04053.1 hypothetical protein CORC01_00392 [Colletotrichum orchidophilum]
MSAEGWEWDPVGVVGGDGHLRLSGNGVMSVLGWFDLSGDKTMMWCARNVEVGRVESRESSWRRRNRTKAVGDGNGANSTIQRDRGR